MIGVEEGEVGHAGAEGAVPERVLAVDVGGDAAAHRDPRVSGQDREPEASTRGHRQELAEGHPRLDLDGAPRRVEAEDAIELLHLDGHRPTAEARRGVGVAAASRDPRSGIDIALEQAVAVGPMADGALAEAAVEGHEERRLLPHARPSRHRAGPAQVASAIVR